MRRQCSPILTLLPSLILSLAWVVLGNAAPTSTPNSPSAQSIGPERGFIPMNPPHQTEAPRDDRSSPIQWFGYTDGGGYAVPGETWTFDHGNPDPLEGWTVTDLTENAFTAWQRITVTSWSGHGNAVNAPVISGSGSAWLGFHDDEADAACWTAGLGYGNSWCQRYTSPPIAYEGSGDLALTFSYFSDLETDYDYVRILVTIPSLGVEAPVDSLTGINGDPLAPAAYSGNITQLEALSGGAAVDFQLVFELRSDGAWSDEDGLWPTEFGPFAVDDIRVQGPDAPMLYWTDPGSHKVQRSKLDGTGVEDIATGTNSFFPGNIAIDVSNGNIYWTVTNHITRANLDGSNAEFLYNGLYVENFGSIALDVAADRMWYVGAEAESPWAIYRGNLDGSGNSMIIAAPLVRRLALDVAAGKVYWTESSGNIRRANFDGSIIENVATGLSNPTGIAVDSTAGKLYWVDTGTSKIQRSNLDGSNPEDLVTTGLVSPAGLGIDAPAGKMYWTDSGADKIQRANLDGSAVENLVTTGLVTPSSVASTIEPIPGPTASAAFDFESGDDGFVASAGDPIGDFAEVNPVSNYTLPDSSCGFEGNVLSLHDSMMGHPDHQHVRLTSPPVDLSYLGGGPKNVFAEFDLYLDLPLFDGVEYKTTWVFFPDTCEVTGTVGWSEPMEASFFYAPEAFCSRRRHFATQTNGTAFPEALPDHAEQVRFVVEILADCDAFSGIPPGSCTGQSNFSPLFDNIRIGATGPEIVHVPSPLYPDIQSGADEVPWSGRTVLLRSPGTYRGVGNRDVALYGSSQLCSEEGPELTIVDCESAATGFTTWPWDATDNQRIEGITITNGSSNVGGALRVFEFVSGHIEISNCIIMNSVAADYGGGIYVEDVPGTSLLVRDCLVIGNRAGIGGGGIYCGSGSPSSSTTVLGTTIAGNAAPTGGAFLSEGISEGQESFDQVIVWGNCPPNSQFSSVRDVIWNCSAVDTAGVDLDDRPTSGVFEDPLFCGPANCNDAPTSAGRYTLAADSPCLPENNSCGLLIGARGAACPNLGPDPAVSECTFPASLPDCPHPVDVSVVVLNGYGAPVVGCPARVDLVLDSGNFDSGQITSDTGVTDASGQVSLTFACGVSGSGMAHFEVSCDAVLLCTSSSYAIASSCESALLEWDRLVLDDSGNAEGQVSMALDGNGGPHIAYYDAASADLMYMTREADVWVSEEVDPSNDDEGNATGIVVDGSGRPHISHYDQTTSTLKHAIRDAGVWTEETVDDMGVPLAFGHATAIDLYADVPRIAYYAVDTGGLKLATSDGGGGWTFAQRDLGLVVWDIALAIDANGLAHIGYTTGDYVLRYATFDGVTWTVVEVLGAVGTLGVDVSIALDATGNPHLSFVNSDGGLSVATRIDGVWDLETVRCERSQYPSLALDSEGATWISYQDRQSDSLAVARREPDGVWRRQLIADVGEGSLAGGFTALALTPGDAPMIAFHNFVSGSLEWIEAPPGVVEVESPWLPVRYALHAARPNPFNPLTTIRYDLPESGPVSLTVYDVAGRRIRSLVRSTTQPAGSYNVIWDGRDDDGRTVGSGVYFYSFRSEGLTTSRRMILAR